MEVQVLSWAPTFSLGAGATRGCNTGERSIQPRFARASPWPRANGRGGEIPQRARCGPRVSLRALRLAAPDLSADACRFEPLMAPLMVFVS